MKMESERILLKEQLNSSEKTRIPNSRENGLLYTDSNNADLHVDNTNNLHIDNSEDNENTTSSNEQFGFKNIPRTKKLFLVGLSSLIFFGQTCFSLLAPFFPNETAAKGVSETVTGLIFGAFEFTIFISSPVFGCYISKIGTKFMAISGGMVCGACAILFGVLPKGPGGTAFIVASFLCRIMEGLGASALYTAIYAIMGLEFRSHLTTVYGYLQTCSSLGAMVGPSLGGALYELGGYGLPFYVNGCIVIANVIFCSYVMPSVNEVDRHGSWQFLSFVGSSVAIITSFCVFTGSFALGFLNGTLAIHLSSQFHLSAAVIALFFLLFFCSYGIGAPIVGYIGDSKNQAKSLIITGSLFTSVAFLLLGPTPLLPFLPSELWSTILALIISGCFLACLFNPSFRCLLDGAREVGMPDTIDTYGVVAGFFNSFYSLGAFLGPAVGGFLIDQFKFGWAATFCALLFATAAFLMSMYCISRKYCYPSKVETT